MRDGFPSGKQPTTRVRLRISQFKRSMLEQGFEGTYSIVKGYVRGKKIDLEGKATVRFETMPGQQGQMDWGFFEDHLILENGKFKKLYCFLLVLGYSRMRYIEFVTDMSTNSLIRCHANAFRYFGGYP